jgi:hypothetical protein
MRSKAYYELTSKGPFLSLLQHHLCDMSKLSGNAIVGFSLIFLIENQQHCRPLESNV